MSTSVIQSIITWLQTYAGFTDVFDVSSRNTNQLIDFLGTETLDVIPYVRQGSKRILRNDYLLNVSKPFLQLAERKDNADFLVAFQKWVDAESFNNRVPLMGNHGRQRTWVDAQQFVVSDKDTEMAVYQIRLHISYEVVEL